MIKKLHRFYIPILPEHASCTITDPRITHQVSRVLALKTGESFILFCEGSDDTVVRIVSASKKEIAVQVQEIIPQLPRPPVSLIAAIAIPKSDVFETIVQKLTELGVSEIIPIRSHRTVKQSVRVERLQTISDEAVEQSGGNMRVRVHEPMDIKECVHAYQLPTVVFDALGTALPEIPASCIIYIGPEGGWSMEDRALFINATVASLGPRVLRTDTAAIVGAYTILWK